ncbi:hypothetical protein [Erythrobacter sp. F6033]|uniref:hypothetical protein n=1 Tax=Erythrobacter sp. F6033 TaxID=2926401 RepID=UPI001FF0FEE1|nr:hypothetical protein [Erythrobacter sp. F6033]MCK0129387.1 hypothetical protein [Erythrobacter sp. F6033]
MKIRATSKPVSLIVALSLGLTACGGDSDAESTTGGDRSSSDDAASGAAFTLEDNGLDICFKAAAEKLGANTKVASLSTNFGVGENLEQYTVVSTEPGQLKSCSLDYQDPENPNKLLRTDMDVATGEFKAPQPVEISVMGNAADFSLENIVVPLSDIKTAGFAGTVDGAKAQLDETFSSHALSSVRLSGPNPGRAEHSISVDFVGRLKSNDILDQGSIAFAVDGSQLYNNIGK